MPDFKTTFQQLDKIISDEYSALGLQYIEEYLIDRKHPLTFFTEAIKDIKAINPFNWYEFFTEIEFLSKDLKYYTALLFLLRPSINIPSREGKTYYQTVEDKRYMSYASILFQIVYNNWDRLGDFLFCFFETGLKKRDVYFSRVINSIPQNYISSNNYQNLKVIYDKYLRSLFIDRKEIVHYVQVSAKMYSGTFIYHHNNQKLLELEKEKEGYPEFFKKHLELSLKGFEYSVKLVKELKK